MLYRRTLATYQNCGFCFIFLSIWVLSSILLSCGTDNPNTENPVPQQSGVERSVGPEGGIVEITDPDHSSFGAKISVPSNALTENILLSIQKSNNAASPPAETFPAGEVISFLPEGTVFKEAVTISLPYLDKDHDGYIDGTSISEENIRAMVFNKQSNLWQDIPLTGLDTENNLLQIQTTHFTDYEAILYLTEKCVSTDTLIQAGPFYFTLYFDFRSEPNIYKTSISDVGADLNVGNATLIDNSTSVLEEENFQDMFDQVVDATKWSWSWEVVTELTLLENKVGLADEEVVATILAVSPKSLQFEWNFDYQQMAPSEMMVVKFIGTTDTVCTLLDRTPISPQNLTIDQATDSSIQLSWDEVTNIFGTVQYNLYMSEDNGATYRRISTNNTNTGTASGLSPLTGYQFQVTTLYDNRLESDFSSAVTGTTIAENILPTAPSNLASSTITNNMCFLTWDASSDQDGNIVNYIIYISGDDENYSVYSTVTTTFANITGLSSNTTYFFKISAVDNRNDTSELSEAFSITTLQ
jgi:hypothetical protein